MSVSAPLLDTIEPDELNDAPSGNISDSRNTNARQPVVLTPTTRREQMATTASDAESGMSFQILSILSCSYHRTTGIAGIFRQVRRVVCARAVTF